MKRSIFGVYQFDELVGAVVLAHGHGAKLGSVRRWVNGNPAAINIEPTHAMRQHIGGHSAQRQRLACDANRFMCWL